MPTALFVQRDAAYHLVRRRLRGTCTREQWDNPRWRQAALDRAWAAGIDAVRDDGLEFVCPAPVTLIYSGGSVFCADIRLSPKSPPMWVYPDGRKMPLPPLLNFVTVRRTTYKHWAEGPLIHVELMSSAPGLNAADKRAIDALPNAALREAATKALGATAYSVEAQDAPDMRNAVDFRIRGIFKAKDYTVLASKQSHQGSKLVLPDGSLWDGGDGERAPDNILGD
jgi:hypothetical protein